MKLRSGQILGLAMDDRGILCALVTINGAHRLVQRLAKFNLPAGASYDRPESLAGPFNEFLKAHGLSAGRAVIGVPAKWLIAQEKDLPPSDPAMAIGVLRLQAERMSLADHAQIVSDFTGQPGSAATRVLLVGILKKRLDHLQTIARGADLTLLGVTATSLVAVAALADATNAPLLMLGEQGAEMAVQQQGSVRMLRHLGAVSGNVSAVGAEARRALTLGNPGAGGDRMLVWDGIGLSEQDLKELSERSGMPVQAERSLTRLKVTPEPAAVNGGAGAMGAGAFLPAVALAIGSDHLPVDFLHSRLAEPKQRRIGRTAVWSAIIAAALIVAGVALYTTAQQREQETATLQAQLKQREPEMKQAQARLDRLSYGREYYETRPPYLECLREVTLAFNYDEAIWASSFTLRDASRGQLQGKCTDQRLALALLDRLKANPRFTNVQLLDLREATGRTREISFSISFTFTGNRLTP